MCAVSCTTPAINTPAPLYDDDDDGRWLAADRVMRKMCICLGALHF